MAHLTFVEWRLNWQHQQQRTKMRCLSKQKRELAHSLFSSCFLSGYRDLQKKNQNSNSTILHSVVLSHIIFSFLHRILSKYLQNDFEFFIISMFFFSTLSVSFFYLLILKLCNLP